MIELELRWDYDLTLLSDWEEIIKSPEDHPTTQSILDILTPEAERLDGTIFFQGISKDFVVGASISRWEEKLFAMEGVDEKGKEIREEVGGWMALETYQIKLRYDVLVEKEKSDYKWSHVNGKLNLYSKDGKVQFEYRPKGIKNTGNLRVMVYNSSESGDLGVNKETGEIVEESGDFLTIENGNLHRWETFDPKKDRNVIKHRVRTNGLRMEYAEDGQTIRLQPINGYHFGKKADYGQFEPPTFTNEKCEVLKCSQKFERRGGETYIVIAVDEDDWNNSEAVLMDPDYNFSTTANWDLFTKTNMVTANDVAGVSADQVQLGPDGSEVTQITPDNVGINSAILVGTNVIARESWGGQSVTPSSPFYLTAVNFYIGTKSQGTLTSPAICRLYATSGGVPAGAALMSTNSIAYAAIVPNSLNKFTFTSSYYLEPGTLYAISFETTQAAGGANDNYQLIGNNTNPYAGGTLVFITNAIVWPPTPPWSSNAGWDARCNVQGENFKLSGNALSPNIVVPSGKYVMDTTIEYTDCDATYKFDQFDWYSEAVSKAQRTTDITGGVSLTMNQGNITSGLMTDLIGNVTIRGSVAGDGSGTLHWTDMYGSFGSFGGRKRFGQKFTARKFRKF